MQRYFARDKKDNLLILNNEDLYHIKTVMRLNDGDKIEVVYDSKLYIASLIENNAKIIKEEKASELSLDITLCIPLLSEQKFSFVLQKATELGVSKIIPVIMQRSIVKLDSKKSEKKLERWYKICKEASEQSKRVSIPIITDIKTIDELKLDGLKLICSTTIKNSLKKVLQDNLNVKKITFIVGPEGGFTKDEESKLTSLDFTPFTLGQTILRVETVPISILSILNYELTE